MENTQNNDISQLSPAERVALIGRLRDSFNGQEPPLTPNQYMELQSRLACFKEDKGRAVSWEALKAELSVQSP